jgi:hypothetical protein
MAPFCDLLRVVMAFFDILYVASMVLKESPCIVSSSSGVHQC